VVLDPAWSLPIARVVSDGGYEGTTTLFNKTSRELYFVDLYANILYFAY
jgi:hypothetical protein